MALHGCMPRGFHAARQPANPEKILDRDVQAPQQPFLPHTMGGKVGGERVGRNEHLALSLLQCTEQQALLLRGFWPCSTPNSKTATPSSSFWVTHLGINKGNTKFTQR